MKTKTVIHNMIERLGNLAYAAFWTVFAAVMVLSISFRVCRIAGSSMNPTISDGDWALLRTHGYTPGYEDIVTFDCSGLDKMLIKRVIGLPGDTIVLIGNKVYRNGELLDEPYAIPCCYNPVIPMTYHVDDGCIFVLGDNRPISNDSRDRTIGLVKEENVRGVVCRMFPAATNTAVKNAESMMHFMDGL